jgi:hypothetical protein
LTALVTGTVGIVWRIDVTSAAKIVVFSNGRFIFEVHSDDGMAVTTDEGSGQLPVKRSIIMGHTS